MASESLRSRRARLPPTDVGLSASRNGRRVAGLRREELALLAGVSPDYYARLEQGRATDVSDQVLDAVSDALRLDALERTHLGAVIRPNETTQEAPRIRPAPRAMIAALDPIPAVLHGPRLEVLAINGVAAQMVAILRVAAMPTMPAWSSSSAKSPRGQLNSRRAGRLAGCSSTPNGPQRFHHDSVGTMTLNYETMHLRADPGLSLIIYTAAAGSPSEAKLRELLQNG